MKGLTLILASLTALLFLLPSAARASDVTFALTQDGPVTAGGSVDFDATITNSGSSPVFINGDGFSASFPLTLDDTNFQLYFVFSLSAPISIDGGTSLSDVDVFTITVDPTAAPGTYSGTFDMTGGADEFASDLLDTETFDVVVSGATPAPEPGVLLLLGVSLIGLVAFRRRLSPAALQL